MYCKKYEKVMGEKYRKILCKEEAKERVERIGK